MFSFFKENKKEDEIFCSFCLKEKHLVEKLVAGPAGNICLSCVATVFIAMDENTHETGVPTYLLITATSVFLENIEKISPEIRGAFFQLLLATRRTCVSDYNKMVYEFIKSRAFKPLYSLLRKIPAEDWNIHDAIVWTYVCAELGLFEEALQYPEFPLEKATEAQQAHLKFNRIAVSIELVQDQVQLKEYIDWLQSFKAQLLSDNNPIDMHAHYYLPALLNVTASCHLKVKQIAQAELVLQERKRLFDDTDETLLLRGEICKQKGDFSKAASYWKQGIEISRSEHIKRQLKFNLESTSQIAQ